jgi:4-amino-4-deoxy-L-arabinose transferase-like glycosyltransferase
MVSQDACDRTKTRVSQGILVVLVLLVALFFRTFNLVRVPPGLDGDEMFNGWDALRVWEGNLAVYFPANYGREPLLIYLVALTTRLLGVGPWAMRLASVLCGIVGLLFTWSLARRLFSFRVAILAAALMSVSLWPVLLNRVALRAGLLPACQAVAVYALWRALEDRSGRWAVVAGLFTGLSLYTYTASRVFPFVLVLWLLLDMVSGGRLLRDSGRRLVLVGLVAGLVLLPLGVFALRHPEIFNQRVNALNFELNQVLAGNLTPVWRSARALLGMFTQAGDREWRYNPSGRPVFDKVTGALFYLGVIVSLFRVRRPAYQLLLIWLPVMLIPDILSIGTPSFWRTVGALTPIYLMPAIGADSLWERVEHWARRFDRRGLVTGLVLPVVVVVGLAFVGADTWRDYFGEWARSPQVLHTYEADLAAAARYLNDYTPADTAVWVSSEYPGDLSRWLWKLQSTYAGPVRWFDGNQATVWPSGWAGQDVLLLFTGSSPPNPDAVAALSGYLIFQESDAAGRPHLWVYRIPGEPLSEMPWRPSHTVGGRFAYNREILGYDAPAQVQRQTEVPVVVYWRVPPGVEYDASDLPHSFVCLQDQAAGRCLEEVSHYMAYPLWDWTVGDVVAERYMVPVPAYLLPQTTYFTVGMYDSVGEISFADEQHAGAPLLAGPVEVVGTASVDPQWDAETPTFGQVLALVSYGVPTELSPGSTLKAELQWQAMRSPESDTIVRLELRGRATGDVAVSVEELLGSDRHPTSRWVNGEPVHTFHNMQVPPDLGSGEFDVYLLLSEAASGQMIASAYQLGTVSVSGRPHYFELPVPEYPLTADFGSSIRLLGFDLEQVDSRPGGHIEVVLYWQALTTIGEDYKVFVHVYHPTDDWISGQHDSSPGDGAFPTSSWLPGEVVTDAHLVAIEPDAAVGVCKVGVGLYIPSTGQRLPVQVDGHPQPDDALIITQVEVR